MGHVEMGFGLGRDMWGKGSDWVGIYWEGVWFGSRCVRKKFQLGREGVWAGSGMSGMGLGWVEMCQEGLCLGPVCVGSGEVGRSVDRVGRCDEDRVGSRRNSS